MTRPAVLWTLLLLFALRVAGQLLVAIEAPHWLPPMDEWQSGLLPYPILLLTQAIILVFFGIIAMQFSRGAGASRPWGGGAGALRPGFVASGIFVRRNRRLGAALWVFGWTYACVMVARYILTMALRPEKRWTGDLIPVVFHIILASFVLTVAGHHRRSSQP